MCMSVCVYMFTTTSTLLTKRPNSTTFYLHESTFTAVQKTHLRLLDLLNGLFKCKNFSILNSLLVCVFVCAMMLII